MKPNNRIFSYLPLPHPINPLSPQLYLQGEYLREVDDRKEARDRRSMAQDCTRWRFGQTRSLQGDSNKPGCQCALWGVLYGPESSRDSLVASSLLIHMHVHTTCSKHAATTNMNMCMQKAQCFEQKITRHVAPSTAAHAHPSSRL